MHNTNVSAKAQKIPASFATPAAFHWFHVTSIRNAMLFLHVQMEIVECFQINVACIAIEIVAVVTFRYLFFVDFRMLIIFEGAAEDFVAIRAFDCWIFDFVFDLILMSGANMTTKIRSA